MQSIKVKTDGRSVTVQLSNVRISYPYVFDPRVNDDGTSKYSASFFFPKEGNQALYKKLLAAATEAAKSGWPTQFEKTGRAPKGVKLFLRDAEDPEDGKDDYGESWYFNAYNTIRPTVVDGRRQPIQESDGLIYPGARVNVLFDLWCQDNKFGKRINASLSGVQFAGHDDRLGGGGRAAKADEFDEVEDGTENADGFFGDGFDDDDDPLG